MKYSGVFPVGKLITPFGLFDDHSKKRRAVIRPSCGKLSKTI